MVMDLRDRKLRATPKALRLIGRLSVALALVGSFLVTPGAAIAASQNEVLLNVTYDGTPSFDVDSVDDAGVYPSPHTPGLDARADNGVVRTYDAFGIRIDWNVNEEDATNVVLTATLPDTRLEWIVPDATNPTPAQPFGVPTGCLTADADGVAPTSEFTTDGRLICNVGDQPEGSNGTIFADVAVGGYLDGDTFNVSVDMATDNSTSTVSDVLDDDLVASAAPKGAWVKTDPEVLEGVPRNGVDGDVFIFPLTFTWSTGTRGSEPLNDGAPIRFFEHPWDLPNVHFADDVTIPGGRVACGQFDGVTVLASTGSWSCSETLHPTDGYPVIQIDITDHDTAGQDGVVSLHGQAAFWVARSDLDARYALETPQNSLYNSITGSAADSFVGFEKGDPLATPPVPADEPGDSISPIQVTGTNIVTDELSVTNNTGIYFDTAAPGEVPTGTAGAIKYANHNVRIERGRYKQLVHPADTEPDVLYVGPDRRRDSVGGMIGPEITTANVRDGDTQPTSRGEVFTIIASTGVTTNGSLTDSFHSCTVLDTDNYNLVPFDSIVQSEVSPVSGSLRFLPTTAASVISSSDGPLAHVLTGRAHKGANLLSGLNLLPESNSVTGEPLDYVVEFGLGTPPAHSMPEDGATCNDTDAQWIPADVIAPGQYAQVTHVRVRLLTPVDWAGSTYLGNNTDINIGAHQWDNFGARHLGPSIVLVLQAQVKTDLTDQADGEELFVYQSRGLGPWVDGAPEGVNTNYRYVSTGTDDHCQIDEFGPGTVAQWTDGGNTRNTVTGWCNEPWIDLDALGPTHFSEESEAGVSFTLNRAYHGDKLFIVGASLDVNKTNLDGVSDFADNGDLVRFRLAASVTGAPTEALTNVRLTDNLNATRYEFVRFITQPADAPPCVESANVVTCQFSEPDPLVDSDPLLPPGRAGGWSDFVEIEVRKSGSTSTTPPQFDANTVTADSDALGRWDPTTDTFIQPPVDGQQAASDVAGSFMPGPSIESAVIKSVATLEGPCEQHPTEDPPPPGWEGRCSMIDFNGNMQFELALNNEGNTPLNDIRIVDVFPHDADASEPASNTDEDGVTVPTLGDGRTPPSDFAGTLGFVSATSSNAGTSTVWVSADDPLDISRDPDEAITETTWCNGVDGTEQNPGNNGTGACPTTPEEVTATYIAWDGVLNPGDTYSLDLVLDSQDVECDDIWTNTFGARSVDILLPIRSNDVSIMVNCEFDLALAKTIDPTFVPGSDWITPGTTTIDYLIEVSNQGDPVEEFDVTDYVDTGVFTFDLANNTATTTTGDQALPLSWDASVPTAPVATIDGALANDESVFIPVTLTIEDASGALDNFAEISRFDSDGDSSNGDSDPANPDNPTTGPLTDVDSTADSTNGGSPGEDLEQNMVDDEVDQDSTAGGDEDDHDVASIPVYDLELIKTLASAADLTVTPPVGTFNITVTNQGTADAFFVEVTEYPPAGVTLDAAATDVGLPAGVTRVGDVYTIAGPLAPAASIVFPVTFQLTDLTEAPYRNAAEISAFDDDDDDQTVNGPFAIDVDSNPDGTDDDDVIDHNEVNYDPNDNDNLNEVTPGDEDDHDIEIMTIPFDLALRKTVDLTDPDLADGVQNGDVITFNIEVFNQGADVEDFDVTDYLAAGWTFVAGDNPAATTTGDQALAYTWDNAGANPVASVIGALGTAESVVLTINLTVDLTANNGPLDNTAEISRFDDDGDPSTGDSDPTNPTNPASGPLLDLDSTPDDTDGDPLTDDEINENPTTGDTSGDGIVDEDDHDIAQIPIYDLELVKTIASGPDFSVTPPVATFDITVSNQGAEPVFFVDVTEYPPTGLTLDAAATDAGLPAGITRVGDVYSIDGPIAAGGAITFSITFQITDLTVSPYRNAAEISSFEDDDDPQTPVGPFVTDIDSTPDGTDDDDVIDHLVPNYDPDDDGFLNEPTPGDEDDHDIALLELPYRVGNLVWTDTNNDGLVDGTETGIDGVTVELLDDNGDVVDTVQTADGGLYQFFTGPGTYSIRIPDGQAPLSELLPSNGGDDDAPDNDGDNDDNGTIAVGTTGVETEQFTLGVPGGDPVAGSEPTDETAIADGGTGDDDPNLIQGDAIPDDRSNFSIDIGYFEPLRIGSTVWLDDGQGDPAFEDNGLQDNGEPGIAGVLVQLLDDSGAVIAETVTDANGDYVFDGLPAGDYQVGIPDDQTPTLIGTPAPTAGATDDLRSSTYQTGTDTNSADNELTNADDDGEAGTVGGADFLAVSDLVNLDFGTEPDTDAADETRIDVLTGVSREDTNSQLQIDFGLSPVPTYRIGNLVFEDYDDDGVAEDDEPGVQGVLVQLLDDQGDVVAEVVTDVLGKYEFTDLPAGEYQVQIPADQIPDDAGLAATIVPEALADARSSGSGPTGPTGVDADTDVDNNNDGNGDLKAGDDLVSGVLTLGEGDDNSEPDDETLRDDDATDDDPGTQPTTIRDDRSNVSVDFGIFRGIRLGNQVWLDDGDGLSGPGEDDGDFDTTEVGIVGVDVELWEDSNGNGEFDPNGGDTLLDTSTTDGEGNYLFTGVEPGSDVFVAVQEIPGGSVVNPVASSTATSADPLAADNVDDGAPDADEGYISVTALITVPAPGASPEGETDTVPAADDSEGEANDRGGFYPDNNSHLYIDLGFVEVPLYRVGNLVWLDANNNGIADDGETGIAGILVQLLDDMGVVVAETVTDIDGLYEFTNLSAGEYQVNIPSDQTPVLGPQADLIAGALDGLRSSDVDAVDPDDDVDNDDNGVVTPNAAGGDDYRSGTITLGNVDGTAPSINTEPSADEESRRDAGDDDDTSVGRVDDDQSNTTVDFGFYSLSLGNQVWNDANNNGVLDAGETPIPDVAVELWVYSGTGDTADIANYTLVTDTITGPDGDYLFTGLIDDQTYKVVIPAANFADGGPLDGLNSSTGATVPSNDDTDVDDDDNGIDPAAPGDAVESGPVVMNADAEPTATDGVEVGALDNDDVTPDASEDLTVDFGFYELALGDTIFFDNDNNGILDGTDVGVDDVVVQLFVDTDMNGVFDPAVDQLVAETVTMGGGQYYFDGLVADDYFVHLPPANFADGAPLDGYFSSDGNGVDAPDVDDDATDSDDNGDPIGGPGGEPIAGVVSKPITLEPGNEPTDDDGSDDPNTTGIPDGNENTTVDMGFYTAALGDTVFFDNANTGTQDAFDGGIPDVTVNLYIDNGDGIFDPAVDELVDTDVTDIDGKYYFDGLREADYFVAIPATEFADGETLDGLYSSTGNGVAPDVDDDPTDGDDNGDPNGASELVGGIVSQPVTLDVGAQPTDGDDGDDPNSTGIADAAENTTVDFGLYTLEVGDRIFLDVDNNELFDGADTGIEGVTVNLLDEAGVVVATTVTDAAGNYLFTSLQEGTYSVELPASNFDEGGPLAGLYSSDGPDRTDTPADVDADTSDIDDNGRPADPATKYTGGAVITEPFDLAAGTEPDDETVESPDGVADTSSNLTIDLGLTPLPPLELGNQLWIDANNNGEYDAGEEPVPDGVLVNLWSDTDGDGVPDVLVDTFTTTGGTGVYLFTGLTPGAYIVQIDPGNLDADGPLAGFGPSTGPGSSTNPNDDVDSNNDGFFSPSAPGIITGPVTLAHDTEPTDEGDDPASTLDSFSNLSVDIGLIPGLELGNQIFIDAANDGDGAGDEPVPAGVTVNLIDVDGNVIASTMTDTDGRYRFAGLAEGDYVVEVPASNFEAGGVLDGYLPSTGPASSNDPNDDVDLNNDGVVQSDGSVRTGTVTLVYASEPLGEADPAITTADAFSNLTVDIGVWSPVFDLALRKTVAPGQTNLMVALPVTFTIEVFNQGDVAATNVSVIDYLPASLTLSDSDWTAGPNGSASIVLAGPIEPGTSTTVDITAVIASPGDATNAAEIGAATAIDPNGSPIVLANGDPLSDVDSVPDTINDEIPVDDVIDNSGDDEDDHDPATITALPIPEIPRTGNSSDGTLQLAALLLIAGAALFFITRRDRRRVLGV